MSVLSLGSVYDGRVNLRKVRRGGGTGEPIRTF